MATEVVIPMLGVTIETGIIVEWLKNEGDPVQKGESLFVVEADKVVTEVESPAAGVLAKILLPVGQKVPVLTVVAVITEPGEAVPARFLGAAPVPAAAEPEPAVAVPAPAAPAAPGPLRAVPAARALAREKGLDLGAIRGSGPEGVILHRDVVAAAATPAPPASHLARRAAEKAGLPLEAVPGTGVRGRVMQADVAAAAAEAAAPRLGKVIPMDRMRRIIARRMAESAFTAPHIYFFSDVGMDALLAFREQILPDFEARLGLRPSVNDFLIKAAALTIRDYPMLNASVRGEEIHIQPDINVCLAVALPDGLITRPRNTPRWRPFKYDQDYPTFVASDIGAAFIRKARELGFHVAPHTNHCQMNPDHPLFFSARDFCTRDPMGLRWGGWSWMPGAG